MNPRISTCHPTDTTTFQDYPVAAEWIWALIQSQKMPLTRARRELVRSAKCLTRHMPNLDRLIEESITHDLDVKIKANDEAIEASPQGAV